MSSVLNRRLLRRMLRLRWDIAAVHGTKDEVFVEWQMRCALGLGPSFVVCGVSRARARGRSIVDHRDDEDLGEVLASAFLGGQRVLDVL